MVYFDRKRAISLFTTLCSKTVFCRHIWAAKKLLEAAVCEVPISIKKLPFVHNLALNFFSVADGRCCGVTGYVQPINSEQRRTVICMKVNLKTASSKPVS